MGSRAPALALADSNPAHGVLPRELSPKTTRVVPTRVRERFSSYADWVRLKRLRTRTARLLPPAASVLHDNPHKRMTSDSPYRSHTPIRRGVRIDSGCATEREVLE